MERLYFPCRARLNGADNFVVWYEDERDGFLRLPIGSLLVASSREALTTRAKATGVRIEPETRVDYDFDGIREWCRQPIAEGVQCPVFLDIWNFFDDLAALYTLPGTKYAQLSRAAAGCYDKLFWGNNLPSVTPPGERFDPHWSQEELAAIRQVFEAGLEFLEVELVNSGKDVKPSAAVVADGS